MSREAQTSILRHLHRLTAAQAADRLPDAQLLERFTIDRDEAAFTALVERHGPLVLGVCRRVLRHEHEVEDAFQATFLVLVRKAGSVRKHEALGGWLYRVAYRLALKARARAVQRWNREAPMQDVPAAADEIASRELCGALDEELNRLPERYRLPIILCCLEGRSRDEAAAQLGCTAGAVKGLLERGRQALRARLERRGLTLSGVLLAALLTRGTVRAAVPALLAISAVRTALAGAAGAAPAVAALAEAAMPALLSGRLKLTAVLLLVLTLLGGAGLAGRGEKAVPPAPPAAPVLQPPAAVAPPAGGDAHGDPLPPGARARLGTLRLRHGTTVHAAAFAPDGKVLASADMDGHVRLWNTATGKELVHIRHGRIVFFAVAFAPDGKVLATTGLEDVALWDAATGKEIRRLQDGKVASMTLAFSPDGKFLATGSNDNKVRLWNPATGELLRTLQAHAKHVYSLAFSADGKVLASGSDDRTIRLWDVATGKHLRLLEGHRERVWSLAFSPDGKRLASADDGPQGGRLWDVAAGKETHLLGGRQVAFLPDGKTLVTGGHYDARIRFWDTTTGKLLRTLDDEQQYSHALAVSTDGKLLAVGGQDGTVRLWDLATGGERFGERGHHSTLLALAFSPDGKTLAAGGGNASVGLWDLASGRILRAGGSKRHPTRFLVYAPDGQTLLSADTGVHLYEWDATTGKQLSDREGPGYLLQVVFRPGRGILAGAAAGNRLFLWDVALGKQRTIVQGPESASIGLALALTSDGKTVAAASDNAIYLWDTETGTEIRRLVAPGRGGWLTFAPDDRTLATSDGGSEITLWDTGTGKLSRRLQAAVNNLQAPSFSPDGRLLACGAHDGSAQVWEVATGGQVCRFQGHRGMATAVAFAPDGRALASASCDSTVLLWDLTGRMKAGRLAAASFTAPELDALWLDLAGEDAARAYSALWALAAAPAQSVPLLGVRLEGRAADEPKIARWIAELDHRRFAVREKAMAGLAGLNGKVEPALKHALGRQPTEEARRRLGQLLAKLASGRVSERWGSVRGVQALERIGTPEARRVLRRLSGQREDAALAREARSALRRLGDS